MQAAQSAAKADGVVTDAPEGKNTGGDGDAEGSAAADGEDKKISGGGSGDGDGEEAIKSVPVLPSINEDPPQAEAPAADDKPAINQMSVTSAVMGGEGGGGGAAPENKMDAAPAPPPAMVQQAAAPAPRQPVEQQQAPAPAPSEPKKRAPLRRGKWTPEEEAYANRLIQEFKAGLLPLTDGTTLRTFLSKLLNCDPMRISKKFVGSNCIGKQVFRRRGADVNNLSPDEIEKTRFELSELEKKFLDRVAQNKSSKSGGGGGSSSKKSQLSSGVSGGRLASAGGSGGLGGMNNNMNKSAAAVGRALLQGNKAPQQQQAQGNAAKGGDSSAGGLLAQLQAQQPGMFDSTTARSFLNAGGSQGGGLGNMNTNASITNLMLQTGMSRDQISQLAQKGISSSTSLANMLGKQRSFDQLMSLDFQSMQSIDNLANLIQAGMPNQARIPKAQMKNMDWGTQGMQGNPLGNNAAAAGLLAGGNTAAGNNMKGTIENLVRTLSANSQSNMSAQNANNNMANATNFGNFLQNATQQGNNLGGGGGGGGGGGNANDLSNIIQSLQQQQQ
ncbi:hypothetical protein ACHAXR_002312, partial [Thalassiosira sp. AJA248-18]